MYLSRPYTRTRDYGNGEFHAESGGVGYLFQVFHVGFGCGFSYLSGVGLGHGHPPS